MMDGYWKQRNGETIKISDMSDNHLRNTIQMIERNVDNYRERISLQLACQSSEHMSEHSLDAIYGELARVEKMNDRDFLGAYTQHRELLHELESRKDKQK